MNSSPGDAPHPKVKALLLAAGLGTRLRPLTDSVPKCLVPVAGRPLLDYWVDRLAEAGIREARINTHALADQVRAYIDRVNRSGKISLSESYEPELLGSAGTVAANASWADDADLVVIVYADNLSDVDLPPLLAFHRSHGDPFTMLLFRASNPRACGIAELDSEGRVVSFVEKPENPRGDLANAGLYVIDASAYREIARLKAFDLGYDVLPRFVGRMRGWSWEGYHRDIGTLDAWKRAQTDFPAHSAAKVSNVPGAQPAVFLDRDGTLIEHVHYLSDPAQVRLLPDVPEALRRLQRAGFACIVITNQSAIGRGMITEADCEKVHDELQRQLAEHGVQVDAFYSCPIAPTGDDRTLVEHPDRKPGPGLLLRAARERILDLRSSWMIGDMISDLLAGRNAGCRGSILVRTGQELTPDEVDACSDFPACDSLLSAAGFILADPPDPEPPVGREGPRAGAAATRGLENDRR